MKKTLVIWFFVAVILVGGLTILGFKITKAKKPYRDIENTLKEAAISVVGQYPLLGNRELLTLDDLKDNGFEVNMNISNEVCQGYVVLIKSGQILKYKPFVKCSSYETKGFDKSKVSTVCTDGC